MCKHLEWEAADPVVDGNRVTWGMQRCLGCGELRESNMLKPGETITVPISWVEE